MKCEFIGSVIAPVYYYYSYIDNRWIKIMLVYMNERDLSLYKMVESENKFISDEELDEIIGYRKKDEKEAIQLKR